jgi:hypothetical protein
VEFLFALYEKLTAPLLPVTPKTPVAARSPLQFHTPLANARPRCRDKIRRPAHELRVRQRVS